MTMPQVHVLVAEQEGATDRELPPRLEELGYAVQVAVTGNEKPVHTAIVESVDIVIIDTHLSGSSDAFELAGRMRDKADRPVVFISSEVSTDMARRAAEAGVYGWLVKPFRNEDLQATLEMALQRHQLDRELRTREARYRLLAEYSTDMISAHAPDGTLLYASPGCTDQLGFTTQGVLGSDVYEVIHPEDFPIVQQTHEAVLGNDQPARMICRVQTRDGQYVWVETTCKSQVDPQTGETIEIIAVTRNISDRKQMEKERQRIQKLESVGTLAGGIAHDFNNLLTGILGNISLAKVYTPAEGELGKLLTEAEKASLQAKSLTQQLLIFAKGGQPIKKQMPITGQLVDWTQFALKGSNVQAHFDIAADLWPVEIDEGQFSQVIRNIVSNADQAMPDGGCVHVRAVNSPHADAGAPLAHGPLVKISIQDNGIGISEEHQPRVFDPYFTTKQRGSGLGLAVAHSVVAAHGGHIGVESHLGEGATFHIYLPAIVAKQERPPAQTPPASTAKRVLVMDDEQLVCDVACRMLNHLGYDCESAKDGEEAIGKYRLALESGRRFDLVLMDLTVPGGMGGIEAIARLIEIDSTVHALVSSGYSTDPILKNPSTHGFRGFVSKPYQLADLQQAIEEALSDQDTPAQVDRSYSIC